LLGHEDIAGAETVVVADIDGGTYVFDQEQQLGDTTLAVAELGEAIADSNLEIELAKTNGKNLL
jgi:hypothetical protein